MNSYLYNNNKIFLINVKNTPIVFVLINIKFVYKIENSDSNDFTESEALNS